MPSLPNPLRNPSRVFRGLEGIGPAVPSRVHGIQRASRRHRVVSHPSPGGKRSKYGHQELPNGTFLLTLHRSIVLGRVGKSTKISYQSAPTNDACT